MIAVLLTDDSVHIINPHSRTQVGFFEYLKSRTAYFSLLLSTASIFVVNEFLGGDHRLTQNIYIFLMYTLIFGFAIMALFDP